MSMKESRGRNLVELAKSKKKNGERQDDGTSRKLTCPLYSSLFKHPPIKIRVADGKATDQLSENAAEEEAVTEAQSEDNGNQVVVAENPYASTSEKRDFTDTFLIRIIKKAKTDFIPSDFGTDKDSEHDPQSENANVGSGAVHYQASPATDNNSNEATVHEDNHAYTSQNGLMEEKTALPSVVEQADLNIASSDFEPANISEPALSSPAEVTKKTEKIPSSTVFPEEEGRSRKRSRSLSSSSSSSTTRSSSSSSTSSSSDSSKSTFDDTSGDPNYSSNMSSSSSSDTDGGNENNACVATTKTKRSVKNPCTPPKNVRKRKSDPKKWKRNIAKAMRNTGHSYSSLKATTSSDGSKEKTLVTREAKIMKPPCDVDKCRLKCGNKISEEKRQSLFNEFWGMGDLQQQRMFIVSCTTKICPRYRYSASQNSTKNRGLNNAFYFKFPDTENRIRVCKTFFMATLGINSQVIQTALKKQSSSVAGVVEPEKRGKHGNHAALPDSMKEEVRNHIRSIPRMESHYSRADSKIEYVEGGRTVADLHRDYKDLCKELRKPSVNYDMYRKIFTEEFNISFFTPKKDKCDYCEGFRLCTDEEKQQLQEAHSNHVREKELSRSEKLRDKESTSAVVTVYDLQAALPCPQGDSSSFYYVSKLNVYNLSLYELRTTDAFCFMWHESVANRGANEVGSCVWSYLQSLNGKATEKSDVIFYSDNCVGQNRNRFIIAMYIHAVSVLENLNSITHKFLVAGHTQNEGDHVHSIIEKSIKKYKKQAPIYVPDQYVSLVRQAKKNGTPYTVQEMGIDDFLDFKELSKDIKMKEAFKTEGGETIHISDIAVVKVTKENRGKLLCKTSYAQEDFICIDILQQNRGGKRGSKDPGNKEVTLKRAYTKKVGITEKKKKGLLGLFEKNNKGVSVMPQYYKSYYHDL